MIHNDLILAKSVKYVKECFFCSARIKRKIKKALVSFAIEPKIACSHILKELFTQTSTFY